MNAVQRVTSSRYIRPGRFGVETERLETGGAD